MNFPISQVCLATQTSVDHLRWLPLVSGSWSGPVSVAVFAPGSDLAIAYRIIGMLRRCDVHVRDRVRTDVKRV